MTEALWLVAAAACAVLAMGWLALSRESHWRRVFDTSVRRPRNVRLRSAGWVFLALSAFCCLAADHLSMAVLVWLMLLAFAAVAVAITLTTRPAALRAICLPFFRSSAA